MAQVKKKEVRDAILKSATILFKKNGYNNTTLNAVALRANVAVANIYSYFPSKLHILYEIYRPWLERWFLELEAEVRAAGTPREKLRRLLIGFWHDYPARNAGFANSILEALATNDVKGGKPSDLLQWSEIRTTALMREFFPPESQKLLEDNLLAHVLLMAQDGVVINYRWGDVREVSALVDLMTDLLLQHTDSKGDVKNANPRSRTASRRVTRPDPTQAVQKQSGSRRTLPVNT